MKFGQMILRKIIKIVPTKCQILKCTKLDFGELTALPRPSWNKGVLLLREGEGAGKGGEGGERGGKDRIGYLALSDYSTVLPCIVTEA